MSWLKGNTMAGNKTRNEIWHYSIFGAVVLTGTVAFMLFGKNSQVWCAKTWWRSFHRLRRSGVCSSFSAARPLVPPVAGADTRQRHWVMVGGDVREGLLGFVALDLSWEHAVYAKTDPYPWALTTLGPFSPGRCSSGSSAWLSCWWECGFWCSRCPSRALLRPDVRRTP